MNWSKPSSFWATRGSFTLVQIKVTHILRPNLPLYTFLQESFVLLQWNESSILELDAAEFLLTPFPKNKSYFVFERFNLFNLHPQGNPIKTRVGWRSPQLSQENDFKRSSCGMSLQKTCTAKLSKLLFTFCCGDQRHNSVLQLFWVENFFSYNILWALFWALNWATNFFEG